MAAVENQQWQEQVAKAMEAGRNLASRWGRPLGSHRRPLAAQACCCAAACVQQAESPGGPKGWATS